MKIPREHALSQRSDAIITIVPAILPCSLVAWHTLIYLSSNVAVDFLRPGPYAPRGSQPVGGTLQIHSNSPPCFFSIHASLQVHLANMSPGYLPPPEVRALQTEEA